MLASSALLVTALLTVSSLVNPATAQIKERTQVQNDDTQSCVSDSAAGAAWINTNTTCSDYGADDDGAAEQVADEPGVTQTRWEDPCESTTPLGVQKCHSATVYEDPCAEDERKMWLWELHEQPANLNGGEDWSAWEFEGTDCWGDAPPEPQGPGWVDVLTALHRTGLPKAQLQTEPGFDSGKTLVNFDTNFYTTVEPVTETFTLLGAQVTVEATPASYTWHFDSGRSDQIRTTTTPGAPYPDLDVTYAYDDAHTTVHPSVDVAYSAQFSVNGGTWQTIPETATINGDPISRYVAEAEARLSDMN